MIPILVYLATHRRSREDARRTLDVLATAVGGGLLLSLVAGRLTSLPQYWPFSSHHAQGFASAALLVVVVAMPAAAFSRRRSVAAIAVLTLAVSGSRSGVAAAAVALVAIPVLRMMTSQRLGWSVGRAVRIGVAAAGLAIAASLVAPRSLDRVTDTFGSVVENGLNAATFGRASDSGPGVSEADRNVAVRLSVWDELSAHFGVDRIVAVDAGTVDDLLSDVEDGEPTHAAFAAHNIFLQLGVELGWLGALIYAGVSTIGVRLLMRQARSVDVGRDGGAVDGRAGVRAHFEQPPQSGGAVAGGVLPPAPVTRSRAGEGRPVTDCPAVRIIACGTPRSGTTYLQRCLVDRLSGAASAPETHEFFTFGLSELAGHLLTLARARRTGAPDQYDAMWAQMRRQSPAAPVLVEKTANHLRWLPQFLHHDPELRAVVVQKPLAAAAASLISVPFGPRSLGAAYAIVRFDRGATARSRRLGGDRVPIVELAELIDDEDATIARLLSSWQLPAVARRSANHGERVTGEQLVLPGEHWKTDSFAPGDSDHIRRSLRAIPAAQRRRLLRLEELHAAAAAGGRERPRQLATLTALGFGAPAYVLQSVAMHAKDVVIRRLLVSLFLRPARPGGVIG